jgi:predicted nucleic acid-binding protein
LANRFIIDTDVCIDFLRGQDFAITLIKNLLINNNDNVYINILTYYEFLKGAYSKKEEKAINDFVEGFEILNLDKEITRIGAEFYRK